MALNILQILVQKLALLLKKFGKNINPLLLSLCQIVIIEQSFRFQLLSALLVSLVAIYGFWLEITWCHGLENICDRKL